MVLHFHLPYTCHNGETLRVVYCLMPGHKKGKKTLYSFDNESHTTELKVSKANEIRYRYEVCNADGIVLRSETIAPRRVTTSKGHWVLCDRWSDDQPEPALLRGAFASTIFHETRHDAIAANCIFRLFAPEPPAGYRWAICGECESLGQWNEARAVYLTCTGIYRWEAAAELDAFTSGTRYKYMLLPEGGGQAIWEHGDDRVMPNVPHITGARYLHTDTRARFDLPRWHGAGVVIPVFSLRTYGSQGIGDFGDLQNCVEWAAACGMRAVQVLPINDTTVLGTWADSYPYSAISVFALHPLYLDLREWRDTPLWTPSREADFAALEQPELDYEAVFKSKTAFLRELYALQGEKVLKSAECCDFIEANKQWLTPYALFSHLRNVKHTANFRNWGKFAEYSPKKHAELIETDENAKSETNFYIFVQYLLHRQMTRVHERARELGVVLKGDIPIGVSPCGTDAWTNGRLFHFNGQAGAPPDAFSRHGQNWGFPTYNWEAMAEDDYAWWRARFAHMAKYFDAYRLDHVLGFFRIWEIPISQRYGILGKFRPSLPYSREELLEAGFHVEPDELCRATFDRTTLAARLNEKEIAKYFTCEAGRYSLKDEVGTQNRIFNHTQNQRLRETLCDLCEEVLFIRDDEHPDRFHPRIMAQATTSYNELTEDQRQTFNRLHDDYFFHRHNNFWAAEAMKKLPMLTGDPLAIDADDDLLLPCAEDLGLIPASVPPVLAKLHILTLEIQRMPKASWTRFGRPHDYPYLCVCAACTHDMSPFRLWWIEDRERTQAYWHEALGRTGDAPYEATPEVCETMMAAHLNSPSMLCLQAMQDWLALSPLLRHPNPAAEQINIPANPQHKWAYRLHVPLEIIRADTGFTEKLRGLIARSGRARQ